RSRGSPTRRPRRGSPQAAAESRLRAHLVLETVHELRVRRVHVAQPEEPGDARVLELLLQTEAAHEVALLRDDRGHGVATRRFSGLPGPRVLQGLAIDLLSEGATILRNRDLLREIRTVDLDVDDEPGDEVLPRVVGTERDGEVDGRTRGDDEARRGRD